MFGEINESDVSLSKVCIKLSLQLMKCHLAENSGSTQELYRPGLTSQQWSGVRQYRLRKCYTFLKMNGLECMTETGIIKWGRLFLHERIIVVQSDHLENNYNI